MNTWPQSERWREGERTTLPAR